MKEPTTNVPPSNQAMALANVALEPTAQPGLSRQGAEAAELEEGEVVGSSGGKRSDGSGSESDGKDQIEVADGTAKPQRVADG